MKTPVIPVTYIVFQLFHSPYFALHKVNSYMRNILLQIDEYVISSIQAQHSHWAFWITALLTHSQGGIQYV